MKYMRKETYLRNKQRLTHLKLLGFFFCNNQNSELNSSLKVISGF